MNRFLFGVLFIVVLALLVRWLFTRNAEGTD